MYKITNKSTGFIQYRNTKEAVDFIKNNTPFSKKYSMKKIKEVDTEDFLYMILGCSITIILTFAFMYFGLK